jgi:hypothetical protein
MKKLIELLEMMAKNNLSAWEEGSKIKHDSYMKGKGDAFTEVITLIKQIEPTEKEVEQSPSQPVQSVVHEE